MSACRKTVGVYQGQFKLRGNMGEKWPKIDHIPPHFYFWAHILSHFWAPGVVSPQVSVYWILVPCRGASVWDHADICPPGIYFSSLPRSKARHHRARIHFLSYYPNIRKSPGSELIHSPPGLQCLVRQFYVVWEALRRSFDPHTQNSVHIWESQ